MTDEKFIELLKEALKARLKTPSLPQRLTMEPNREYLLKLTGTIDNPFRPGTKFYTVLNLEDNMEYRLPPNFQLEQILKDAKPGDYILLVYLGSIKTPRERRVNRYAGAILSGDEVSKLKLTLQPQTQTVEVKAEVKAEESKSISKQAVGEDEVRKFIESLIEVYGSVKVSEVDYYLNKVKKMNVTVTPEFLANLGFTVEDGRVRKK